MAALKYWVWLTTLPGLGERAKLQLLAHFGSPEEIYFAPEGELLLAEGITKLQAPKLHQFLFVSEQQPALSPHL